MSSIDAAFALVTAMEKDTAELAKARETVEKLVKTVEGLTEPLNRGAMNVQRANPARLRDAALERELSGRAEVDDP